ncbi:MAG: exodeoxyribonuclease VII small subunit [Muribaculaceae bacterium]|nr:exodeoxyribonuclease VII small subunit [Muribaculaceae bacterium]MDE5594131.1 exodeoxyribonuclease VII small subunit [Muribaculaceae bacterium]MDE6702948.1 exodeoxyribonuclease VII small subunit [Muribaculaceae bacterium]
MKPVNELSYNQALAELEQILAALRGDDCDVDKLTEMTARAVELLNHCRSRLTTTDEELRRILDSLQS